jgi:hypothetical protein
VSVPNTSGEYNFSPGLGEDILYAFQLCGIRPTQLTQQHFVSARMAANMVQGRWSADGVNLWQVQLYRIPLIQGVATYQLPTNLIVILDAYYTINNGVTEIDRIMMPVSRSEYAAYSNKNVQGACTTYWMDRLLAPTVTLYPVPNGQQAFLKYYALRQTQDANMTNGQSPEIPFYFVEAFCTAVAYRLALIWAPSQAPMLKLFADEAWQIASKQNTETSNFFVTPMVSQYFR